MGVDKNTALTLVFPIKNTGKITLIFLFSLNFSVPQKGETWGTTKKCENKNKCHLHTCELLKIEILNIAIRKKIIFKLSFLILNIIFVNVNKHLAIPFVKLAKGWSRVCHLCFFCLYGITGLSIPTLPCYLHFDFCLYCWSISNLLLIHLTIRTVLGDRWETERGTMAPWITRGGPKLKRGSDLKGGTSDPSSCHGILAKIFQTLRHAMVY